MIAVIGSGPAGISAARALVARGRRVLLLDGGLQLEPERRDLVDRLGRQSPDEWPAAAVRSIREASEVRLGGVPEKLTYGSDFPYREARRSIAVSTHGCETQPTLARGGFSTVWGACVLPYADEDLEDWPISTADLAPHYRAVTGFVPLAASHDDLAAEFPIYSETARPLRASRQAGALMRDLERSRPQLRAAGVRFGGSRLAVRADARDHAPGCAYCGLCMHGCPYRLIYDASDTLDALIESGHVEYRAGLVVERLEERGDRVVVRLREIAGGERSQLEVDRVYVGCGPLSTTRLVLSSLDLCDRPVTLRDSQYFLLPWLRLQRSTGLREEALHTLCQVFLELRDPAIDPHNVHLQIYGYNDLYARLLDGLLGPLARPARPAVDALLARLLLIQGYLHSDSSPSIEAVLERRGDEERLHLTERSNPVTRKALRRVTRRLVRLAPSLRALPLSPLLRVAPAGRGFHSGGSFPMREEPGELETDLLGRPTGMTRIHLVDASTFPTIPSTTITFTVMANAHRIASAAL